MDGPSPISQYSPMPRANLFRSPANDYKDESEVSDQSFSFSPAQRVRSTAHPPARHSNPHNIESRSSQPVAQDNREPPRGRSPSPQSSPSRGWPSGLFDSDAFPSSSSIGILRAEQDRRMGVTRMKHGTRDTEIERRKGKVSPLERLGRYISGSKQAPADTIKEESDGRRGRVRTRWIGGDQKKDRQLKIAGGSLFEDGNRLPTQGRPSNPNHRYAVSPPPRDQRPQRSEPGGGPSLPPRFSDAPRGGEEVIRAQPPLRRQPEDRFRSAAHRSSDGNFQWLSTYQDLQTEHDTLVGGCFPASRSPSPEPSRLPPPPPPTPPLAFPPAGQAESTDAYFLSTSPFNSSGCTSLSPPTPPQQVRRQLPLGYSPQSQKGMFFPGTRSDESESEGEDRGARLYQGIPVADHLPELGALEEPEAASAGTVYGVPLMGARAGGVGPVETSPPPILEHGSLVTLVRGGKRLAAVQQGLEGRWTLGHPNQSLWEEGPEAGRGRWPLECLFLLLCPGDGCIGLRSVVAEGLLLHPHHGFKSWKLSEEEMWRALPPAGGSEGGWSERVGGVVEGPMVLTALAAPHTSLHVLMFGLMAKSLRAWRQVEESALATPILRYQVAQLRGKVKELLEQKERGKEIDCQEARQVIDHLSEEVSHLKRQLSAAEERVAKAQQEQAERGMAERLQTAESQLDLLREKVGQLEVVEQEAEALRDHLRKLQDKELHPQPRNATPRQRPKWGAPQHHQRQLYQQQHHYHHHRHHQRTDVDLSVEGGPLLRRKMSVRASSDGTRRSNTATTTTTPPKAATATAAAAAAAAASASGGEVQQVRGGSGSKRLRVQRRTGRGVTASPSPSSSGLLTKSFQTESPPNATLEEEPLHLSYMPQEVSPPDTRTPPGGSTFSAAPPPVPTTSPLPLPIQALHEVVVEAAGSNEPTQDAVPAGSPIHPPPSVKSDSPLQPATPPPSPPAMSPRGTITPPVTTPVKEDAPPAAPPVPAGVSRSAIKRRVLALRARVSALKGSEVEVEVEVGRQPSPRKEEKEEKENKGIPTPNRGKGGGDNRPPLQSVGQGEEEGRTTTDLVEAQGSGLTPWVEGWGLGCRWGNQKPMAMRQP